MGLRECVVNGSLDIAGEFYPWKIYRVSGDADLDFIVRYERIEERIAQIWWAVRNGKDWYMAVVKDGEDALFGEITDDFRKASRMIVDYSDNKLYVMDQGIRKHIINKYPGHPCNMPTEEQVKAAVKK